MEGQRCSANGCEVDPCFGVECTENAFCRDGVCVDSCGIISCSANQRCADGRCIDNPCTEVMCVAGEVCVNGSCLEDLCGRISCDEGSVCRNGECVFDPCHSIDCPAGERCEVDEDGQAQCIGAWTDPPEPEAVIEEIEEAGTEMIDSETDTEFVQDIPPVEEPADMTQTAEAVSGCQQRKPTTPNITLLLFVLFGLFLRKPLGMNRDD